MLKTPTITLPAQKITVIHTEHLQNPQQTRKTPNTTLNPRADDVFEAQVVRSELVDPMKKFCCLEVYLRKREDELEEVRCLAESRVNESYAEASSCEAKFAP